LAAFLDEALTIWERPAWERERAVLRFGPVVVKEFHKPADAQWRILDAFEEEGWPQRIDDPLPADRDLDRRDRLRTAIRHLNEAQSGLIRFQAVGTGDAVTWERAV
jgi:hypothetical protein